MINHRALTFVLLSAPLPVLLSFLPLPAAIIGSYLIGGLVWHTMATPTPPPRRQP